MGRKRLLQKKDRARDGRGFTSMGVFVDDGQDAAGQGARNMQRKVIANPKAASPKQRRHMLSVRKKKEWRHYALIMAALAGFAIISIFWGDAIYQTQDRRTDGDRAVALVEATFLPEASREAALPTPTQSSRATLITEAPPIEKPKEANTAEPLSTASASLEDIIHVFIPASGSRYHALATCSGMIEPREVTLSVAKAQGLTPCKRCNPPE